ncbi:MAG TPA: hypothetical protein ENG50_05355 [Candidatus Altiarchaeales archaeon]|nr:hypothetical protein [Candidatus Altiarchaeales archaeon]
MKPLDIYLLKNLRGIIYANPALDIEEEIKLLKKIIKYRDLGISEKLSKLLKIKPWKKLKLLRDFHEDVKISSLCLASFYATPLIVVKAKSLDDLPIVKEIRTKEKLELKELKRNLRLVNYSILDFYTKALEQKDPELRIKIIENDEKRFWRIKANAEGVPIIAYADPLKLIKPENRFHALIPCLVVDMETLYLP